MRAAEQNGSGELHVEPGAPIAPAGAVNDGSTGVDSDPAGDNTYLPTAPSVAFSGGVDGTDAGLEGVEGGAGGGSLGSAGTGGFGEAFLQAPMVPVVSVGVVLVLVLALVIVVRRRRFRHENYQRLRRLRQRDTHVCVAGASICGTQPEEYVTPRPRPLPADWAPMGDKPFMAVHLKENGDEWHAVCKLLKEYMESATVVRVTRVQNPRLWRRYHESAQHHVWTVRAMWVGTLKKAPSDVVGDPTGAMMATLPVGSECHVQSRNLLMYSCCPWAFACGLWLCVAVLGILGRALAPRGVA